MANLSKLDEIIHHALEDSPELDVEIQNNQYIQKDAPIQNPKHTRIAAQPLAKILP